MSLSEPKRRGFPGRLGKFWVWRKTIPGTHITVIRWPRIQKMMGIREYTKFREHYYKYREGAYFWDIEEFLREGK